jgi:hypothetical protein
VVPRAAQRLAGQQAVGERRAVVGAVRAEREDLFAAARQEHRLAVGVTLEQRAVRQLGERDAGREIGSGELLRSAHGGVLRSRTWR